MSAESFNYEVMSNAFDAAFERDDLAAWHACVSAHEMLPVPLWLLDRLAIRSIIPMNRKNRERNARLDAHDRELAAIKARLGLEQVAAASPELPTPVANPKPRVRYKGAYVLGAPYLRADAVRCAEATFVAIVDHPTMIPGFDPGGYEWRKLE